MEKSCFTEKLLWFLYYIGRGYWISISLCSKKFFPLNLMPQAIFPPLPHPKSMWIGGLILSQAELGIWSRPGPSYLFIVLHHICLTDGYLMWLNQPQKIPRLLRDTGDYSLCPGIVQGQNARLRFLEAIFSSRRGTNGEQKAGLRSREAFIATGCVLILEPATRESRATPGIPSFMNQ